MNSIRDTGKQQSFTFQRSPFAIGLAARHVLLDSTQREDLHSTQLPHQRRLRHDGNYCL